MSNRADVKLETIVSLAKRRGFVFQTSEIYGGLSGFYDYGPYGSQLARNIKNEWWKAFVEKVPNIHGLDSAIIQNPNLWKASGHVDGFNDPMVDCKECKSRLRADHVADVDSNNLEELNKLLSDKKCPVCGNSDWTDVRTFNMMFKTFVGPAEDSEAVAYLRPETAGGIFTNFKNYTETARAKVPFGIAQIGKAFRNEISPRDFIFRLRELEQMEIEYFVDPEHAESELENMRDICWDWLKYIGLTEDNLHWHQHTEDERAHYADDAWDIQFKYPFGTKELWGVANRTDYDLKHHAEGSGKDLTYFDQANNRKFVPFVIEPSVGVDRLFLAVLVNAYTEEEVDGEQRVVLKIDKKIAPVKYAVLPLVKNKPELVAKAKEIYQQLVDADVGVVEYDESGTIGKRYRRQDEIGTPKCITVDFDTLEDDTVTIRDRDTMEQQRINIDKIV